MRLVQDREAGVLRRYKVAPITPHPLLFASIVTGWVVFLPLVGILAAIAHWKYGMPWPSRAWTLLPLLLAGLAAFRALGLVIAAATNNTQESNALIQLVYMPCLLLSGATIPLAILPGWCRTIAGLLPATYLVSGLGAEFGVPLPWGPYLAVLGALLLTTAGCISVAAGLFRWDPEQRISPRARFWLLAGLAPFLLLGLVRHFAPAIFPSP
jgi:ABC-2 type transport system permease protein